MLVDQNQEIHVSSKSNDVRYSPEFYQVECETIEDLSKIIEDDAVMVLILSPKTGHMYDITEELAALWIASQHEKQQLTSRDEKPVYVENSEALYEYSHDYVEDY